MTSTKKTPLSTGEGPGVRPTPPPREATQTRVWGRALRESRRPFQYLIIYCTATPAGRWISAEDVKRWHTKPKPYGNGWKQVGYSDLILLDGTRHTFVKHNNDQVIDSFEVTNGVAGINLISRHLCYVGGLDSSHKMPLDSRTPQQISTMLDIIGEVLGYAPKVKIAGHNQFDNKSCPSFFVPTWLKKLGIPEHNIEWRDPFGYRRQFRNG